MRALNVAIKAKQRCNYPASIISLALLNGWSSVAEDHVLARTDVYLLAQRFYDNLNLNSIHSMKLLGVTVGVTSISLMLINLAAILEKADEGLLPAVYKEVGQAFNASPSQLGTLTFIRALVQAISSPLAGILAIRYHRPSVVGLGTLFWGCSTAAVAFSQNFSQCALFRAINGIGLAIVIPALQSFIADSYLEETRGVAFGWLSLVGCIGGVGGSMAATILAAHSFGGLPGWRLAFLLMAIVSSLIGWLVHVLVVDPKGPAQSSLAFSSSLGGLSYKKVDKRKSTLLPEFWRESYIAIKAVIKVRTFQIIVLQGLVGSLPWTAMVFFTMWFELIDTEKTRTIYKMQRSRYVDQGDRRAMICKNKHTRS
ncbi:hypothetical protein O6H91_16G038900 [Diphasiastrum complanatum]|uniref:Uncharacterized protein n=1 Tax=Diphasiastrum complanatum TaxID=34168 RepID=A0ACC2BCJ7_DIPCM|nr:hypothetical protein O6H91_16G038900 [Diphasiastrum complanatum]